MTIRKRFRFGTLLTAVIITLTGVVASPAVAEPGDELRTFAVQNAGGTKRLTDVPRSHKFYQPITWMYVNGLTAGIKTGSGVKFAPRNAVSREAMAAFMYREAGSPSFKMPKSGFADVPRNHKFYRAIMWMKASGLSTGTKTSRGVMYQPSSKLTRQAMAAFLYREAGSPSFTIPKTGFTDTPKGHKFYRPMMWMKASGLSKGISNGNGTVKYAPRSSTTREAMAAFMYRKAGYPQFIDSGSVSIGATKVEVGEVLIAQAQGWKPGGLTYSYQWLSGGAAISGATAREFTVRAEDVGRNISVKITVSKSGLKSTSMTTKTVKPVARQLPAGNIGVTGVEYLPNGWMYLGATGTVSVQPTTGWHESVSSFSYQWTAQKRRHGAPVVPISGATSATYTPDNSTLGSWLRVTVTATHSGGEIATATSEIIHTCDAGTYPSGSWDSAGQIGCDVDGSVDW